MAHVNRVLRSINADGGSRCVDIFQRPDGTAGFEEYRRDPEDGRGWFPIASYSARNYPSESAALDAALIAVPWLRDALARTSPR
jgi:hypothetical protein